MPELPELQAHAERLDAAFAGAVLERFEPLSFTALKTASPQPTDAHGQRLVFVGRRGKHLLLDFGVLTFVVHLMQGGRLRVEGSTPGKRPRKGLARWWFGDSAETTGSNGGGGRLLLTEAGTEKRAGIWAVVDDPETQPPLDGLGPDADRIDPTRMLKLAHTHPMRLHGLLRDQHIIAGIGRRLANEVCHRAKLSPFASTARLEGEEADRIVEAIGACVNEALAFERGLDDMSNSPDRPGNVHHRQGQACLVCGDTIRAIEYRAYTVNYCPACQTDGRILADNTTSKFLK